jgi:hypothetical protein
MSGQQPAVPPQSRLEGGDVDQASEEANLEGGGALMRAAPDADNVGDGVAEVEPPMRMPPSQLLAPSAGSSLTQNVAMAKFSFSAAAFSNPVQAETKQIELQSGATVATSPSQPTASKDLPLGGGHAVSSGAGLPRGFSTMSASALANFIGGRILNFKTEVWTAEDVSGAAFLEVVSPPQLFEFLEQNMLISSSFTRTRVANLLRELIAADASVSDADKQSWVAPAPLESASVHAASAKVGGALSPHLPHALFQTPVKEQPAPASFLSEIKGRVGFLIDDSVLFRTDSSALRATVETPASGSSVATPSTAQGGAAAPRFEVVINQPSAEKPKYIVLETVDNADEFSKWLRKNREETVLALPVDRRPLTHLMVKDCKEEIARVIVNAKTEDPLLFCDGAPYPVNGWTDVTEKLLLRVLFARNGPTCADAAKEHLKKIRFFFNDSTTHQKLFTAKLRKHCKRFASELQDFDYVYRRWPDHDKRLSHLMIIDAFAEGFNDSSTVLGPDNSTQVPKCSSLAKIREFIRQRKECPLEDIVCEMLRHFERRDITVKSDSRVSYEVNPWRSEGATGQKKPVQKRKFNQIEGGGGGARSPATAVKQPRPAAIHPRCNNCGSKGHKCGERTCFFFGHPKAKGPEGEWPEGTPSLRLEMEDMKEWSKTRKPIFYAYPENQGSKKHGA